MIGIIKNVKTKEEVVVNEKPLPPLTNAEIQALRQAAYLIESDPLLMAINSYERRGKPWKDINDLQIKWLAKIEEINERYPYDTNQK
jgi:hypothetical protein